MAAALALASSALLSPAARASGATQKGPFAVGFTHTVEWDGRDLGGVVYRKHQDGSSARPVPMMVFYPVDEADTVGALPAQYPAQPFPCTDPNPVHPDPVKCGAPIYSLKFSSTLFEMHGVDGSFQEPPPSAAGPFPLVVLLAGGRAVYFYNVGLATRLASHGFVVALVAHYGDRAYAPESASDPLVLARVGTPLSQANPTLQRALNRLYDIQLAIDVLSARSATPGDLMHGLVDPARIAAGGHSVGGLAGLHLTGGDDDLCDSPGASTLPPCSAGAIVPVPIHEPRIRALLLYEPSVQLLHWQELHRVTVPAIVFGRDPGSLAADGAPAWIGGWAHQAMSGHPTYATWVVRTAHLPSFTSACAAARVRGDSGTSIGCTDADDGVSPIPFRVANELVWRYAVAFLKTELAGEHGYQPMLTPGWAVSNEPLATFYVNERKNGQEPEEPFGDPSFVHMTQPNPDLDYDPAWVEE